MRKLNTDARIYDGMLLVVSSHLQAARSSAIAIYRANPCTHGFDPMDNLAEKLGDIIEDVANARKRASEIEAQK